MRKENAIDILEKYLGPKYVILECFSEENGCFQFRVKEKEDLNDDSIFPDIYGVDANTGKILNGGEVLIRNGDL